MDGDSGAAADKGAFNIACIVEADVVFELLLAHFLQNIVTSHTNKKVNTYFCFFLLLVWSCWIAWMAVCAAPANSLPILNSCP